MLITFSLISKIVWICMVYLLLSFAQKANTVLHFFIGKQLLSSILSDQNCTHMERDYK